MLAGQPSSDRSSGGILVRMNGATVNTSERLSGSQDKSSGSARWSEATITWGNEAHSFSGGKPKDASSSAQLVHVIKVNPSEKMESRDVAKIHVNCCPVPSNVKANAEQIAMSNKSSTHANKNKVPVTISTKNEEEERSSSGASSAPGSDYGFESDHDNEDVLDSNFPTKPRIISVNANNVVQPKFIVENKNNRLNIAVKDPMTLDNMWNQFHVYELQEADHHNDADDVHAKIEEALALLKGQRVDNSPLRNIVRTSIVSLLAQSAATKENEDRVVLYLTSMGVVRSTFEQCRKVKKILDTLMLKYEERDVFMCRAYQPQLRKRLQMQRLVLPQIFVAGRYLGGAEIVEQLNEIGVLRDLLRPYKKQLDAVGKVCQQCGGFNYIMCPQCGGSKKSPSHRHHFIEDQVALRCVNCDENGLIRCQICITGVM